jgi:dinuclear metal center YbgI/SA1388 family protein
MTPTLKDVIGLLEEIAPTYLAEPWDNPGLQVGSYSHAITGIFLALDPTLKAVKGASRRRAQLLLTHHPLLFKPLSQLDMDSYPGNVILEAVKSGISVVAVHTNLDAVRGGINDILAELLDLQQVDVLKAADEVDGAGLGRIGNLPEPGPLSELAKSVKGILGAKKLRVVGGDSLQVRRVAVVGGSGGGLVALASQKGADLLLTGDVSHHHALEAESLGIALIDTGHFQMEKKAFRIFAERLRGMLAAQGWQVRVEVDEEETDPMRDGG